MNLSFISSAIFVKDIEVSKAFYTGALGLVIEMDFGTNVTFKNSFAIWQVQPDHIIPTSLGMPNIADSRVNRFELYFETEELEHVYNALKARGTKFLHEIHEELWGQRTIRFFDPDNHLIEIGESMKQFVFRYYEQGLTIEEVSKRTFVPVEGVKHLLGL